MARVELEGLGWIDYDFGHAGVPVGDRLLPPALRVELPGDGTQPGITLALEIVDGLPQCRSLTIEAGPQSRGVRTTDLRAVALEDWIERFFALTARRIVSNVGGVVTSEARYDEATVRGTERVIQRARAGRRRAITDEFLSKVAAVYRAHIDDRPLEAVRTAFGGRGENGERLAARTAAMYVQRARTAGHLPPTTKGKKKA